MRLPHLLAILLVGICCACATTELQTFDQGQVTYEVTTSKRKVKNRLVSHLDDGVGENRIPAWVNERVTIRLSPTEELQYGQTTRNRTPRYGRPLIEPDSLMRPNASGAYLASEEQLNGKYVLPVVPRTGIPRGEVLAFEPDGHCHHNAHGDSGFDFRTVWWRGRHGHYRTSGDTVIAVFYHHSLDYKYNVNLPYLRQRIAVPEERRYLLTTARDSLRLIDPKVSGDKVVWYELEK